MPSSASAKSGERSGPERRAAPFGNVLVPCGAPPTSSHAPLCAPAVPPATGTPTPGAALCSGELKCQELLTATHCMCGVNNVTRNGHGLYLLTDKTIGLLVTAVTAEQTFWSASS